MYGDDFHCKGQSRATPSSVVSSRQMCLFKVKIKNLISQSQQPHFKGSEAAHVAFLDSLEQLSISIISLSSNGQC